MTSKAKNHFLKLIFIRFRVIPNFSKKSLSFQHRFLQKQHFEFLRALILCRYRRGNATPRKIEAGSTF